MSGKKRGIFPAQQDRHPGPLKPRTITSSNKLHGVSL